MQHIQPIEEDLGNLAVVLDFLPVLNERWLKAIRAGKSGDEEWAKFEDTFNRSVDLQLLLTDRMVEEGHPTLESPNGKAKARLQFGYIGLNGDRPLAVVEVNGKRVPA